MKPHIALLLILIILILTIIIVIKKPSIGIQASCICFLLNLAINIFTKKVDSN